jgi:hypothetical protein
MAFHWVKLRISENAIGNAPKMANKIKKGEM